ncbi:MAG: 3-oxoacyl-[acyl-carrier-protein] synthase III C-terminal domain-containing protein, partial [Elusimicrobiota bacterium]
AQKCIERSGARVEDISHILFVSTTGLAAPSLDARLSNALDLHPHIERVPIWGLGCAGGVSGLAKAAQFAYANPGKDILLVIIELCSLSFVPCDLSKKNLVASAIFADGAAALILRTDGEKMRSGPSIIGWQSTLWPKTEDIMGWDVTDEGLRVVFSTKIPLLVRRHLRGEVDKLLARHHLGLADISHFILHPGGTKVLQAYQTALGLSDAQLAPSWKSLNAYGNMSAASVFFVLDEFQRSRKPKQGEYGLMAALGPGFCCELALLRF